MVNGLFLPDGTFHPFSAAELSTELATRSNAGVLFGELEGWLNTLPDPDPVLRKRGDDAAILRELSADEQVTTAMLSRKKPGPQLSALRVSGRIAGRRDAHAAGGRPAPSLHG